MLTAEEITDIAKKEHANLTELYNSGEITRIEFNLLHDSILEKLDADLIEAGYRFPPVPVRDYGKEIDAIKAEIAILKEK